MTGISPINQQVVSKDDPPSNTQVNDDDASVPNGKTSDLQEDTGSNLQSSQPFQSFPSDDDSGDSNSKQNDKNNDNNDDSKQKAKIPNGLGQNNAQPQKQSSGQQQKSNNPFYNNQWGDLGGGDDFGLGSGFGGLGGGYGGFGGSPYGGKDNSQETPKEDRVDIIKRVYKDVLNREAEQKDINYYKYSSQNEAQMKDQILKSDEHKNLLTDGKKYPKVKEELEQKKLELKSLEAKLLDSSKEIDTIRDFLNQKNAEITKLRASNNTLTSSLISGMPQNYGQTSPQNQNQTQMPVQAPLQSTQGYTGSYGSLTATTQPAPVAPVVTAANHVRQGMQNKQDYISSISNQRQIVPKQVISQQVVPQQVVPQQVAARQNNQGQATPQPTEQQLQNVSPNLDIRPVEAPGSQYVNPNSFSGRKLSKQQATGKAPSNNVFDKILSTFN